MSSARWAQAIAGRTTLAICEGFVWSLLAMAVFVLIMDVCGQWRAVVGDAKRILLAYNLQYPIPIYSHIAGLVALWILCWIVATMVLRLVVPGLTMLRGTLLVVVSMGMVCGRSLDGFDGSVFDAGYTLRMLSLCVLWWALGYFTFRLLFARPFLTSQPRRYCEYCNAPNPTGWQCLRSRCVKCGRKRRTYMHWTIPLVAFPVGVLWVTCVWFASTQWQRMYLALNKVGLLVGFALVWWLWSILLTEWHDACHRAPKLGRYCLRCGYDLRGSTSAGRDECPECGMPIPEADDAALETTQGENVHR